MRKLSFNMLSGALYRILTVLTGLAVQRYILAAYGSAVNGATASIAQFLSYLALLEAGIGAATVSSLNKPLRNNDHGKTSALLSECGIMYRRAGLLFLLFLAGLSIILPIVSHGEIEPLTVFLLTVLGGISSVISYLSVGRFTPLLTADGKIGALYLSDTVTLLLSCGARILLMRMGANIVTVQAAVPICALLRALIVTVYVKKRYSLLDHRAEPSKVLKTVRRSAMTHQVVGLVVNHTDITLLTLLSNLKNVSLYSVYHYVYSSISTLLEGSLGQTMTGHLGKKAAEGQESFNSSFSVFETLYNTVLYLILSVALVLTLPFVSVYTAGITDVEYSSPLLAVLFCVTFFLNLIRLPSIVAVNVYGLFKDTEKSAIIECAVNLGLSLILFPFMGIYGLLLGTVAAYLFRTQDSVRFVYKKCGLDYRNLIRVNLGNLIASAVVILLFFVLFPISATSFVQWIVKSIAVTLISALLFFLSNSIFNRRFIKLLRKGNIH